ncbi:sulfotransferase family 2 domain-containing protein [Pseudoalteromonas shioyasakiensis]|uniref:sulfotransferase family 2 domain-containing protein n=1 Tax=Pseudoalteromonas shioyasakiensis TaxID=1190813 RepID=UPI002118EBE6|nr:sulfotransferase family 2 domain-containing protein [Pseudoalteromonas shioyasakiensis]MCQ8879465.1 sulfotransferase family 2 domain-containing protein [Pseudoalteromonas shioyasakiensis]
MIKLLKQTTHKVFNRLGYEVKLHRIAEHCSNNTHLAFVHIPKSGGISIDLAMRKQFAIAGQPKLKRTNTIAMSLATFPQSISNLDDVSSFSDHHATQLPGIFAYHLAQNWSYISGHLTTNTQLLNQFAERYHFITVLREPVSRFKSNYIFNKLTNTLPIMAPNNLNSDNLTDEVDKILAHRRGWQMANVTSMCITGRFAKDQHDAQLMQQEFSQNLSRYNVVGFLDDLPSFTSQIKQLTNKQINIGSHNVTASHLEPNQQDVKDTLQSYLNEPHIKKQIEHLCRFESENYLRAKDKYT